MAHRFQPRSTSRENIRLLVQSLPWTMLKPLLAVTILIFSFFLLMSHVAGTSIFPSMTRFFYTLSAPPGGPAPTPLPPLTQQLPRAGSVLYTVQNGDSCDQILTYQMHFNDAGRVFSDVNPHTVTALNQALGQDCHKIQPGLTLPLSPQYPLVALGGVVLKISATDPRQVLPTPLIRVPDQPQPGPDCSNGCLLTVRLAPHTLVRLNVQTALTVRVGSWVWAQAMMPRKVVLGFSDYPYVNPSASINGATMPVCDFQVDNTHDDNSQDCSDLDPNTISADGGSWLLAVTGPGGLDHWQYPLHLPAGTQVMLWLSLSHGNLVFRPGNPLYRYDPASQQYVKVK